MDHEQSANAAVTDKLSLPSPKAHLSLMTDGGDIETHREQSSIHSFKFGQERLDIQTEIKTIEHEHNYVNPQSNSVQVTFPVTPDETSRTKCGVVPSGGRTSLNFNDDDEASSVVCLRESSLPRPRTISLEPPPRDDIKVTNCLNSVGILHTGLDLIQATGLTSLTDEGKTQEDSDYLCEDLPFSLPPSSSPPQLFSSSPCASSQSSVGDVESSKMVASPRENIHGDHVVFSQDDPRLDFADLRDRETAEIATAPETNKFCPQMGPTSAGDLELPEKRIAAPDELDGSQPVKRLKPDSLLPPAPKRATLASQHHQFRKLAAPFRPPLKFPIVADGPAQTMNNRKVESTISNKFKTNHDKIDSKGSMAPLHHKASNTSKFVTQFKSPLVNRALPADSRTVRLTPTLQALERRLQLLKRAIKVKEDNEEEDLIRLAEKWIEAGREVAYDVWNATKDTGGFAGKVMSMHRSRGWENTGDRNIHWGWDNKPEDAGEESCDHDQSEVSRTAKQLAPEEEDDVGRSTLGTMLRHLGIAPEIFGWDDDKESFSD